MKSILDKDFRYTNAAETDLRRTFARVRREGKIAAGRVANLESEESEVRAPAPAASNVKPMIRAKVGA